MSTAHNDKSVKVIKASAGSGKTYQLAYEYIKLLISRRLDDGSHRLRDPKKQNLEHTHILAITFTNKATEEMKVRIITDLFKLASCKNRFYGDPQCTEKVVFEDDLKRDFPDADLAQIKALAWNALNDVLFYYNDFSVSTIDAFFQNVLRTFAFDLDLDLDYQVEMREAHVLVSAVKTMLHKAGEGEYSPTVSQWISNYVSNEINEEKTKLDLFNNLSRPKSELIELSKNLLNDEFSSRTADICSYLDDINAPLPSGEETNIARFEKALKNKIEELKTDILDIGKEVNKLFDTIPAYYRDSGFSTKTGITDLLDLSKCATDESLDLPQIKLRHSKLKSNLSKIGSIEITAESVAAWFTAKAKGWKKDTALHEELAPVANELRRRFYESFPNISLFTGIYKSIYTFGLLGVIQSELESYRRQNGIILIGDTPQLLNSIIGNNPIPYIYERYGTVFDNFLIDEFQDTSIMQYENFLPLLKNGEDNDNLIIGDEKQSIYRFRGAAPDLFRKKILDDFNGKTNVDTTKIRNWRSRPNVVAFNNALFTKLAEKYESTEEYSHLLQTCCDITTEQAPGLVRLISVRQPDKDAEKAASDDDSTDDASGAVVPGIAKPQELIVDQLPHYINELRRRRYRSSDIAILGRKRDICNLAVNRILKFNETATEEERINVISDESLLLNQSIAVNLIMSKIALLATHMQLRNSSDSSDSSDKPGEKKSTDAIAEINRKYKALSLLNSRIGKLSESEITDTTIGSILSKVFEEIDAGMHDNDESLEEMAKFSEKVQTSELTGVVDMIVNSLPLDIREKEAAFIYALTDFIKEYSMQSTASLRGLVKRWNALSGKLSVILPDSMDAVTVMTIHKSKGLEHPIIIIPKADWEIDKMDDKTMVWGTREELADLDLIDAEQEIIPPLTNLGNFDNACKLCDISEKLHPGREKTALRKRLEKMLHDQTVENLNITYVAFTRAKCELHIMIPGGGIGDTLEQLTPDDIACIFPEMFPTLPEPKVIEADSDTCWYTRIVEYGVARNRDAETKAEKEKRMKASKKKPLPVYTSGDDVENPTTQVPTFLVPENASQDLGDRFHYLLSRFADTSRTEAVVFYAHRLLNDQEHSLFEKIVHLLSTHEQSARWFEKGAGRVLRERTIADVTTNEKGELVKFNFRPDRLIIHDRNRATIIDYKFGNLAHDRVVKPDPESDATVIDEYTRQVQNYKSLMVKLGYSQVDGYLIYPLYGLDHPDDWIVKV